MNLQLDIISPQEDVKEPDWEERILFKTHAHMHLFNQLNSEKYLMTEWAYSYQLQAN